MTLKIKTGLKIAAIIFLVWFIYIFLIIQPTHQRNWEFGTETLPHISISDNQINIDHVRDFRYDTNNIVGFDYTNRRIDVTKITKVWFVVEPFTQFKQVAHTYFVFDFADQDPLVISVEARREKGESFNAFVGAFNQYELIYIWGTETDETIRRVVFENNKLYMYPLNITPDASQQLLLQLAKTTQQLETTPRFYNTLTSNCTNELAKAANAIKPDAIPWNIALIFPGYSAEQLYKLGFLPTDKSLTELTEKSYISDIVKRIYNQPDFSTALRSRLNH